MDQQELNEWKKVCFVGDFCLSDNEINSVLNISSNNPWASVRDALGEDVAIVANLECPFTHQSDGLPFKWANLKSSFQLNSVLDGLSMAVVSNNHIADFGVGGVRDTLELLNSKGIGSVGYGNSISAALQPAFIKVEGRKLGVVALCCPTTNSENLATHLIPGVAPLGMQTLKQAIEFAHPQCDALIVYLHWGCEWVHDPAPDQLRLARQAIDCGADAVIGCHSHTVQSYEQYRGRWIFYGLGNYLFKAGFAQIVRENGETELVPLKLDPPNHESLAVTFSVVPDSGQGRLELERIQSMCFDDDLVPRPIDFSELTFDLNAANDRLVRYIARNEVVLHDRSEPVFRAQLRNGVLAYWYSDESINRPLSPDLKKLPERVLCKINNSKLFRQVKTKTGRAWLSLRVVAKWHLDKRKLPLTSAHQELYNIIHRYSWQELRDFPNLINCRDFNDKIQWLKLFDQSEEIIRCSDKILVRDYVRERIGGQYLVRLYQVHDHFLQIDFDTLPKSFVIKTNHDSGTVILVRDKSQLDCEVTAKRIEAALKEAYGWMKGEWAYSFVKPKVFVEEFINPESNVPPPDYKFFCVEGQVKFVHFISDRGLDPKEQTVDRNGNDLATELYPSFRLSKGFSPPSCWDEMVSVAESLGLGFKCVRVDLYCHEEKIYAGELTFWPMSGCYHGDGQRKLGRLIDFNRTTFNLPIYRSMKKPIS